MVKKAGATTPLKTRVLEMADDLNQFSARILEQLGMLITAKGSFAGVTLRVFRTISSKRSGSRLHVLLVFSVVVL